MSLSYTAEDMKRIQQEKLSSRVNEQISFINGQLKELAEDKDDHSKFINIYFSTSVSQIVLDEVMEELTDKNFEVVQDKIESKIKLIISWGN